MGGLSTCVQLHFVARRRSVGSPHLPLYYLVSPWAAQAIDLLEVEGTRRRTLPARSSRYACVPRAYSFVLSNGLSFRHDGTVKSVFQPAIQPRSGWMSMTWSQFVMENVPESTPLGKLEKCAWCKSQWIINSIKKYSNWIRHLRVYIYICKLIMFVLEPHNYS